MFCMKKVTLFLKQYEEIISYFIAGVFTTIVSIISYNLFRLFQIHYLISTVLSWIFAVIFAYVINKFYVFKSNEKSILELFNFIKYRLFSLTVEFIIMYIFVDFFKINDSISKIIVQGFVLILNYLFSKIFVFKK